MTINSSLIPLVTPGNVFPTLTEDASLNVRFLIAQDPHYFDVYNRPMGDITVRQLIIAKSLDQLGLRLGHQSNFPFLIPCTVDVSTSEIPLPISWIWDMNVSVPDTWENMRLARIQRLPGDNDITDADFTGTLRLVFTANAVGGTSEIALFYVDYLIESNLSFQIKDIKPATISEFDTVIPSNQHGTIAGSVTFRTLNVEENSDFFAALAPSDVTSVTTGATNLINYEITNTQAGGDSVDGDFDLAAVSHGTGMLVVSAYNTIPPIGVDENSVLAALNYPWRSGTNLTSLDTLSTIPSLLFSMFSITAPQGNRGATLEENYPVILTKIIRLDTDADDLQFIFSTYNTIIGSESKDLIEFASVTLNRSGNPGDVLEIVPRNNLRDNTDSDSSLFSQNFGSGFCILSTSWTTDAGGIIEFFDSFKGIVDEPAERQFLAYVDDFANQRSPFNVPTIGEASALAGSTARRTVPLNPSNDNRYVTELDQGLGDDILFSDNGFTTNTDINDKAYKGGLVRKSVTMVVNTANDAKFTYYDDILPRLVLLLGRSPQHGDEWFDGTTFKRYDGLSNSWIG